jgi:uncharacterized protein (TIGR03067 family)
MSAAPPPPAAPAKPQSRRRLRRCVLALPVVVGAGVGLWLAFLRGPSDDLGRMQGDWAIKGADGRDRGVVRIAGDRWTYHSAGKEQATHRIALNPTAAPKEIDLTALEPDGRAKVFTRGATGVEMKEVGVYTLSGDELRIAKAPAWGSAKRPATLDDPDAPALTLTRVSR